MSTKGLLRNYIKQSKAGNKFLCLDGTYGLNSNEYPLLILATIDINKKLYK